MRVSIALLIIWSALAAAPAHAADLAFNAYWGIPFDGGRAFFGANCELDPLAASAYQAEDDAAIAPRLTLDFRHSGERGTVMSLNGIPVISPQAHYASDDGAGGQGDAQNKGIDWQIVAAVAVGAGLIAAVAAADHVRVSGCSGPNCPPPVQPEPAVSSQ